MNLVLFSNYFPYKKSEPFLENEIKVTLKYAESIKLFTLYGNRTENKLNEQAGLSFYEPVLQNPADKFQLFVKGFFNLAPCGFHLRELISKKLFLSPLKCYWQMVSLLVTRSVLASPAYKRLLTDLEGMNEVTLYFYWGDNLCWIVPYLLKRLPDKNIKVVLRLHGSDLYESLKANHAPLRTKIFELANAMYTVSENGQNYLANNYPQWAQKIHLSRLGVNDFGLNPISEREKKVVVSVSNLVPLKRVHLIFEALQACTMPLTWYHFGEGPLMEQLKALAQTARPGLEVKLMGQVKNEELMRFYQNTSVDVFVNVSTTEGLPVSIMEAFSFGIPAIATRVGGTGELVNSQTGFLLDKDFGITELKDVLIKYLTAGKEIALDYRKQARTCFENKVSLKNYDRFYEEIAGLTNKH